MFGSFHLTSSFDFDPFYKYFEAFEQFWISNLILQHTNDFNKKLFSLNWKLRISIKKNKYDIKLRYFASFLSITGQRIKSGNWIC